MTVHRHKGVAAVPVEIAPQRQRLIEAHLDYLSDIEKADGWHLCEDWDGLLIHPLHPEMKHCRCLYTATFH